MQKTPVGKLRELGANYWKPIVTIISAIIAVITSLKPLIESFFPDFNFALLPSTPHGKWLLAGFLIVLIIIIRKPAVAIFVTGFILGKPKLPPTAGRIFHGARPYHRGDKLPGRERETDDFLSRLQEKEFIILDGESGCGKSSFLNASILPQITDSLTVIECRIADDPMGKLWAAVTGKPYSAIDLDHIKSKSSPGQIDDIRSDLLTALTESSQKQALLISIDQFEELFVTVPEPLRKQFIMLIRDAVSSKVTIILTIRSDFLDLLLKLCRDVDPEQHVFDLGSYYTLGPFPQPVAEAVIGQLLEPLADKDPIIEQQFKAFARDLTQELLRPPRDNRICKTDERTVLPVELQTVGVMLESTGIQSLSSKGLQKLGGKTGLLKRYLDDAKEHVWRKTGISRDIPLLILSELISPAHTKWAVTAESIAKNTNKPLKTVRAVLDALADKYLVNKLPSAEQDMHYELMHEHLVHLLLEAPDPKIQKAQNAQQRLEFWMKQTQAKLKAITDTAGIKPVGWLKRSLAQPMPLFECFRLFRYARTPQQRKTILITLRGFAGRVIATVLLVLFVYSAQFFLPRAVPPRNRMLAEHDPSNGYRYKNFIADPSADSLFVILSLAGEGTRGAALAYGVLETLKETNIVWEGQTVRLIDEVDVISSVSGASIAAAFYGLKGDEFFHTFKRDFLYRNLQSEMLRYSYSPLNMIKLISPEYGRSDLMAEYLDEHLFGYATFGDLTRIGRRPYILIAATDISNNAPFQFSQDTFDFLGSDLDDFLIARAVVAASSRAPLTIFNYRLAMDFRLPLWIEFAREDSSINPYRYAQARGLESYLDKDKKPFIHLKDGSFADRTAISTILTALKNLHSEIGLLRKINLEQINKIVVITVFSDTLSQSDSFQIEMLNEILSEPQDSVKMYRECVSLVRENCPDARMVPNLWSVPDTYHIHVGFENIQDAQMRQKVQDFPIAWNLAKSEIDELGTISHQLLDQSPVFQQLLQDINSE
jgi:NTE family protein